MKKFASRLKEKQLSLGISQIKMAELIGVAPGTLSAYLKDEKCPTLEKAVQIAKALDVPIGWLCGEDTEDNAKKRFVTGEEVSYADMIQALLEIIEYIWAFPFHMEFSGIPEYSTDKDWELGQFADTPTLYISTSDPDICRFFFDYNRVHDLYIKNTIDKEMLEAWVEKRMRSLSKKVLELPY